MFPGGSAAAARGKGSNKEYLLQVDGNIWVVVDMGGNTGIIVDTGGKTGIIVDMEVRQEL